MSSQSSHRAELGPRLALFVRLVLSLALALLSLPLLSSASSADDVAPDPAPVETSAEEAPADPVADPADLPVEDPVQDVQEPAPVVVEDPAAEVADEPAPVTEEAPLTPEPAADPVESPVKASLRAASTLVTDLVEPIAALACDPGELVGPYEKPGSDPAVDTSFEIDGNLEVTCDNGTEPDNEDWLSPNKADPFTDPFNEGNVKDASNFGIGSAEAQNPADWEQHEGTAPGKDDIGDVYLFNTTLNDGHVWSFFGFTRDATNGTTSYDVEYNQRDNTSANPPRPDRTAGDLLLQFDQQGSSSKDTTRFALKAAFEWTEAPLGQDCIPVPGYTPAAGWCPLDVVNAHFKGAVSADESFAEGAVDLTELRRSDTDCLGGFAVMNIRSRASNETTSALKDYVEPQPVNIPGTCATIKIEKTDGGDPATHLGGATFLIEPDPAPGASGGSLSVTDNDANDADDRDGYLEIGNVEPGKYTVTETTAPLGYLLPPPLPAGVECKDQDQSQPQNYSCQVLTVAKSATVTFTFEDKLAYDAPTVVKDAEATYETSYTWDVDKGVRVPVAEGEPNAYAANASQTVPEADPGPTTARFEYQVTASVTRHTSSYLVSGHIWVVNTNDVPMVVTLSDELANGGACTFPDAVDLDNDATNGLQVEVAAGADETGVGIYYECDQSAADDLAGSGDDGSNTATITWDKAVYPQTQADVDALNDGDDDTPGMASPVSSEPVGYKFAVTGTDDGSSEVMDDQHPSWAPDYSDPWVLTWQQPAEGNTYSETRTYTRDIAGDPGTCIPPDVNTAWIDVDENGELTDPTGGPSEPSDTASAVVCVGSDLSVSKNAVLSFTRTYPFDIDKSVAVDAAEGRLPRVDVDPATGKATVPYEVVVTDGSCEKVGGSSPCDSGWLMTGTITVSNPNDFQAVELDTITDNYTGIFDDCDVTVPDEKDALLVPAGGTRTYDYTCTFSGQPVYDGTNTASITWDASLYDTPTGGDSFGFVLDPESPDYDEIVKITEVDKTVDVIDLLTAKDGAPIVDVPRDLGNVTWTSSGYEHLAFTYDRELQGTLGECVTYDNRASVMTIPVEEGDAAAELDHDTASVQVCWPGELTVSKDGAGTFHRRYDWSVQKSILVGPEGNQVEVDAQTVELDDPTLAHSFEYRVKAIPLSLAPDADGDWQVTGTITVGNPNSSDVAESTEVTITEVPDMGPGATCDVIDDDYETEGGATVTLADNKVEIPAEDAVTVDYGCTFDSAPLGTQGNLYAGNSNQATITWHGGEETTPKTAVAFTLPDENRADWSVEVHDSQKTPTLLGVVDHDDSDEARTFEYSVSHTGTAGECETFPNTATIEHVTATSFLLAVEKPLASDTTNAEVCVQKRLLIDNEVKTSFDRSYKWVIDKVADKHNVEVSGNGTAPFEYTVNVGPDTSVNAGLGYVDSGWAMTGTITVTNPNGADIGSLAAKVSDLTGVGGGAVCKVEGEALHSVTVPIGADGVELDYVCTFTSKPAYTGTNTATVTWNLASGVETHSDAVAAVGFENANDPAKASPRETDRVIDVTDAFDGAAGLPVAGLQDLDWVVVKALPGSVKAVKYTRDLGASPGSCRTYPNVVRMYRDGTTTQVGLPADESVTVCSQVGPTLSNSAGADYDRSYAWDIGKVADDTTFSTGADGTAEVGYTVSATPGAATDSGWTMGGSLQVSNPNSYKALSLGISFGTTVGGGAACALTPGQDLVVPASGSRTFTYTCSFTGQPAYGGSVTATVGWGGGTSGAEAPVTFSLDQETDRVVDVVDDKTVTGQSVSLGTAEWNDAGTPVTFSYSLDLAAEANQCEDYTNTAAIVETGQSADATVTVCGPEILPEEEVAPRPPVVKGVEGVLPDTGGPQTGLVWAGLGMLLTGAVLMAARRRRLES